MKVMRGNMLFWVGLVFLSLLCLISSFVIPKEVGLEIVRVVTKPWIVFLLAIGVYFAWNSRSHITAGILGLGKSYWIASMALLLVAVMFLREGYGFRVLNDEYVIGAQAKRLHETGVSDFPIRTVGAYGDIIVLQGQVDKRPPVFSVVLSLVHDFTGYRVGNVFILNAVIAWIFLSLLGLLIWDRALSRGVNLRQLFLLGLVVLTFREFAINVTGGGLEVINLLLILLSGLVSYRFVETGDSKLFSLCVVVNLLLMNARHESVLFLFSFAVVYLLNVANQKKWKTDWCLYLIPLSCLIYVLRFHAFSVFPIENTQVVDGGSMFSFSHFYSNLGHAVSYLLAPDAKTTSSVLVFGFGLVGVLLFLVHLLRKLRGLYRIEHRDSVILAYGVVVVINFGILLCYHWGALDEPEVSRLSLPLMLVCGFGFWSFCAPVFRSKFSYGLIGAVFLVGVCFAMPWKDSDIHLRNNYHYRIDEHTRMIIQKNNFENVFVVTDKPLYWYLYDYAAVNISGDLGAFGKLGFQQRVGSFEVILLEAFRRDPITLTDYDSSLAYSSLQWKTEVLSEFSYKPFHFIRIHRVLDFGKTLLDDGQKVFPAEVYRENPVETWFYHLP